MSQQDFISRYNIISGYFWLAVAALSFLTVCYKIVTEGAQTWAAYFIVPAMALIMYFTKKWMMKRMKKHLQEMKDLQEK
ncbi:MAG: hypothetical protein RLZZ38_1383 [Bacteroidota bacterium]|jgi:hypothetical protein